MDDCFWAYLLIIYFSGYPLDDNAIEASENTIEKLISVLEREGQAVSEWLKENKMTVNPDRFKAE